VVLLIGGYWWWSALRPKSAAAPAAGQLSGPSAGEAAGQLRTVTLVLPGPKGLETVQATVPKQHEVQLEARAAVSAVLAADRGGPSLLREFSLRGFYLDSGGTGYVDLAQQQGRREAAASARNELLALYAIVNTVTVNFPEVRQVRFLVDGKEAQTLAGHIDLGQAYSKRTDLVQP